MKQLRTILFSVGALVSVVPGYKNIQQSLGTPPDLGGLFGGTQIALSALVLLAIFLFRIQIMRVSRRRLARISAACVATFLVSLSLYLVCLHLCTVRVESETPNQKEQVFYFPLLPGGELGKAIHQSSRQYVANQYRRALPDLLAEQGIRLTATTIILLLLNLVTFAALVAAFALLGIRVGATSAHPKTLIAGSA